MKRDSISQAVFILTLIAVTIFSNFTSAIAYEKEVGILTTSISEKIADAGKKTIAVVNFTDLQGNVTEFGRFIAEEVSVDLVSSGKKFEVIDRLNLKTLMAEYKLSSTGIIDPKTAKKLGEIAGADAIVTGTVTSFGDVVKLSVKVLAVDTAKIIAASSADIPKTKVIEELLGKNIEGSGTSMFDSSSSTPSKTIQKQEVNNFLFEVKEARFSGGSLICFLRITNKDEQDRTVTIDQVRMFDDIGNEYDCSSLTLANHRAEGPPISRPHAFVTSDLVSNVPVNSTLAFKINSTNKITLLEIHFRGTSRGTDYTSRAQFRDIPVTKGDK